ncbi:hypothetical protein [Roseisolibacter agri]|uniref:hypothetical protein n=1 Tax=Roseisolibacter agri TaxID=2014610 RepID=UPI0024E13ECF|nr:hypothetical protein [Roseisolibacter agri]
MSPAPSREPITLLDAALLLAHMIAGAAGSAAGATIMAGGLWLAGRDELDGLVLILLLPAALLGCAVIVGAARQGATLIASASHLKARCLCYVLGALPVYLAPAGFGLWWIEGRWRACNPPGSMHIRSCDDFTSAETLRTASAVAAAVGIMVWLVLVAGPCFRAMRRVEEGS